MIDIFYKSSNYKIVIFGVSECRQQVCILRAASAEECKL